MTQKRVEHMLIITEAQIREAVRMENQIGGQEPLISKLMQKKEMLEFLLEKTEAVK